MSMRKIVGAALAVSVAVWAASPAEAHHSNWGGGGGWPVFYVVGGAASVIVNAAIVWNTQCRQLSGQEAAASFFLPIVGIAFDAKDNKCRR